MKMNKFFIALLTTVVTSVAAISSVKAAKHKEAEKHEESEKHSGSEVESEHSNSGEHDEHGDHEEGGEEEENSAVGPEKGITKADKKLGFQLSANAIKTFKLATVPALPGQLMTLPNSGIFYGLEERNIFRLRDGFYKRVDFKMISKTKTHSTVDVQDLKAGDLIVVSGLGFLRIAELAASGGGAVGHAH